ncbi:MAG: N-acetylmuramoyl-L-alanine amidase [Anaerolineae bacterium]|nr:N-acetylmuramoyl-L-alanine amidase [Anaerolineae bacterium]
MSKSSPARRYQAVKRSSSKQISPKRGEQRIFSVTMFVLFIVSIVMGFNLYSINAKPSEPVVAAESTPVQDIEIAPPIQAAPTVGAVDIASLTVNRYTFNPLVGIVSGHKGYDPGAVCPDGLTEAEVNYAVALEVTNLLARQGIQADLLEEFDDRLTEYHADALISIHSDSCNIPGATGFKVARVTDSAIPEAEDQLVACLNDQYAVYTGLPQHPASITDGMTDYHAFREINRGTPGAIIETGFMLDDRNLLQYKPKIVARGIAAGILCFLDQRLAPAQ